MHSKIVHNSKRLAQAKDSREWMHSSWCCDFVYCSAIFCFRQASAENNTWAHRNWTTATFSVFMIACRLLNIFGHQRFIVSNEQHEQRDDGATMMRLRTSRKCFQKKLTAPNDWYLISGCDFEATFLKFCEIQRSICIYLASSFLSLTGRGMVNMSTQISGIIMMKIWSTHFLCGLFRFGRNSVNNWLFSLLSFDGWSKNRLLCIDVLMLHENAAWVSLYYEQCENEIGIYHFFRCWIFRGVCVFLKCYVITRLKNPRSNSFNCYILFLLWTVQLNVLRWLNGIGMALCSPESSFVGNKSACLPSPTSHENAWIAAIFSSFEHRANESMFLLIDI